MTHLAPTPSLTFALSALALLPACGAVPILGSASPGATTQVAAPEPKPDDGITGEVHRQHVGTIVWSRSRIDKDSPDPATFADRFSDSDTLYGRAYLPHSIENHLVDGAGSPKLNSGCGLYYRLYVDGALQDWTIENVGSAAGRRDEARCRATTRQVWIRPDPSDEPVSSAWKEIVESLPPGEHEVRVEMMTRTGGWVSSEPVASGSFTLVRGTDAVTLGESFADLTPRMQDPALEARLLAAIRAKARSEGWKESLEAVKIQDEDWRVIRVEHVDVPKARQISAWVLGRWPDGRCTVQTFSFEQDYDGRQYREATYWVGTGPQRQVDCE